jgi:alanyl-tRNA synthetase
MTERLYYGDSALLEFDARVVDTADEGLAVYLDRTAFYPTSGGQPNDTGLLGGQTVVDVVDEGDRIRHLLAAPLDAGASTIKGRVDARRRADHMQQHTGQHLLSALLEDMFGWATLSVHFGPAHSTIDLDTETLDGNQLRRVEGAANAAVAEARPVYVASEDAATATGLRKPTDRAGAIRVVCIEGIDRSACGGTHVSNTARIGAVLLRGTEKIRHATRVTFRCGERAIRAAREDHELLRSIATQFSAAPSDLPALLRSQQEALSAAENRLRKLERELAAHEAAELYERAPMAGSRRMVVLENPESMEAARAVAQQLIGMPGCVVAAAIASPPSVLLGASEDSGVDAGRVLRDAVTAHGGRGGGSPRLAQGSVPDAGAAGAVLSALRAIVGA